MLRPSFLSCGGAVYVHGSALRKNEGETAYKQGKERWMFLTPLNKRERETSLVKKHSPLEYRQLKHECTITSAAHFTAVMHTDTHIHIRVCVFTHIHAFLLAMCNGGVYQ